MPHAPEISPADARVTPLASRVALAPDEERFCEAFLHHNRPALAYREVFDPEGKLTDRACVNKSREMMGRGRVQWRLSELMERGATQAVATVADVLTRFMLMAAADPNEIVAVKVGCCRYCHGDGFGYQWIEGEYLDRLTEYDHAQVQGLKARIPDIAGGFGYDATRPPHPECPRCCGEGEGRVVLGDTEALSPGARALYNGAKVNKDGSIEIKLVDRQRALENVAKILGAFTDRVELTANVRQAVALVGGVVDAQTAAKAYQELIAMTQA